ncbi:MAG: TM2 domain-containing protein [Asgard group archaeon]|nr:TM2 domain-containing protein [Asgard group archaeon]
MASDSKIVDFLLAFFLGFGVFRFIKGYKTSAIVKLILWLVGVSFIWWVIDWVFVLLDKKLLWPE